MRNKKVDVLFFTMENCHEDFCLFLKNENFNIIQKNCFSKEESFDDLRVIFVDFSFLCAFDFSIITEIRKKFYWTQIIVISEEESVCFAVQSIKFGADDYFVFPCNLELIIEKLKSKGLIEKVENEDVLPEFVGRNKKIIELKHQVLKYAKTDFPILLVGESGTGKSFRANLLSKKYGIDAIIDDGLLIKDEKILAGKTAKHEKTYLGAVRVALFDDKQHRDDVARAFEKNKIRKLLIGYYCIHIT